MRKTKTGEEAEILNAFEQGHLKRAGGATREMQAAREAAASYFKKEARINIRLSGPDLKLLKRKAAEEGMPYQTLIASVLHKFVSGRLQSTG